jgi:hypothetical protein
MEVPDSMLNLEGKTIHELEELEEQSMTQEEMEFRRSQEAPNYEDIVDVEVIGLMVFTLKNVEHKGEQYYEVLRDGIPIKINGVRFLTERPSFNELAREARKAREAGLGL